MKLLSKLFHFGILEGCSFLITYQLVLGQIHFRLKVVHLVLASLVILNTRPIVLFYFLLRFLLLSSVSLHEVGTLDERSKQILDGCNGANLCLELLFNFLLSFGRLLIGL